MMVVFSVLSLGMLNSKYTPSLEYAFSIGYVSNDDCFYSCNSGTLNNAGIPSPSENCVLVMPVGATWWQKEHLETAAIHSLRCL